VVSRLNIGVMLDDIYGEKCLVSKPKWEENDIYKVLRQEIAFCVQGGNRDVVREKEKGHHRSLSSHTSQGWLLIEASLGMFWSLALYWLWRKNISVELPRLLGFSLKFPLQNDRCHLCLVRELCSFSHWFCTLCTTPCWSSMLDT